VENEGSRETKHRMLDERRGGGRESEAGKMILIWN